MNPAKVVDKVMLCLAQCRWLVTSKCTQDSGSEKIVLKVMEESRKGIVTQEEDPAVGERQDGQQRGPDGTGRARSAFRPLGVPAGLSSFVPRPGPLKRSLHSKSSEDSSTKTPQNSFLSSRIKQNAITSSYSSTRGFPPLQRRRGQATLQSCLPRSSTEKVSMEGHCSSSTEKASMDIHQSSSAEKVSTEGHRSNSLSSESSQRKIQREQVANMTSQQKQSSSNGSPPSDSSRPRKRKIPLLRLRRGDPLVLPPAPQPGYRVTAEDLDREKRAALQRINIALGGKPQAISDYSTTQPSRNYPRPAAETAPPPAAPADPSIKSKKKGGRKKQDSPGPGGVWDWPSCNLLEWLPL
ncbi:putative POM121-like protein 1 [Loxodonta africana]|uniref:putative POM121-like protein 1 n=1 Tax=Loxodonta africana TaxID=9785 RepID=UPI0030D1CD69